MRQHKVTRFDGKSPLSHPSPPWTLSHLITFKSIWWISFFLSLVLSFSFFLPYGLFLYVLQQMIMRKGSCCLCKHGHPFSYAFPTVICFRVLPLFKSERCAKMENFKGGSSCYVLPLFVQLAFPTVCCCLQLSSPSKRPVLFYIRSLSIPLRIRCSQVARRL